MTNLTTEELKKWYNDCRLQNVALSGKTDSLSNALRIANCETCSQILRELIRRI